MTENRPALAKPPVGPLSPHLQIYRPQLTSVMSFVHRMTGIALGMYAVVLVAWLIAVAAGPQPFSAMRAFMQSMVGQVLLLGAVFCLFLHLCGGIRHLFWDAGYGFELSSIYVSGWAVLGSSAVLTAIAWIAGSIS